MQETKMMEFECWMQQQGLLLPAPSGTEGSKEPHQDRLQSRRLICEEMPEISAIFPHDLFLPGKENKKTQNTTQNSCIKTLRFQSKI